MTVAPINPPQSQPQSIPVWNVNWLTSLRCRIILIALLAGGFFFHRQYLNHACPINLSGDEAQYWDWSRQLELSYYSKGPLIAYIIRASCAMLGDTMPAIRYPALILGVGTLLITYLLAKRLFGSERLALGAVLLNHLVPMFIAGSLLMTIDSPLFFCWGLATLLAAIAVFENCRWPWPIIGLVVGIGALGKYAMLLWLPILGGFLLSDAPSRPMLKTIWPWLAAVIALVCMTPVVIWNHRHGWVTLLHVAHQTGAAGGAFSISNLLEFIASQIGVVGPTLSVLMVAATIIAVRYRSENVSGRKAYFLAFIGLGFLAFNFLASLLAKVQVNWPAPAYFTLTILTTYFLATRLQSRRTWQPWRGWFYATVIIGLVFMPIARDSGILIPTFGPLVRHLNGWFKRPKFDIAELDVMRRLRGWDLLGDRVSHKLTHLRPGAFVLCDDYQQTAEMAFYVHGQPKTYCAGPYFGKRLSQYDMWPDRRLDKQSAVIGKDAVYVGKGGGLPPEVTAAFSRIEPRDDISIIVHGVTVHTFKAYRCHGFKGFDAITSRRASDAF